MTISNITKLKRLTQVALLLSTTACLPVYVAVPVGLAVAVPVDRGVNYALGGTPGYTITSDDAVSRSKGSPYASARCDAYNALYPYDQLYFSQSSWDEFHKRNLDHCGRWLLEESGQLDKIKANER